MKKTLKNKTIVVQVEPLVMKIKNKYPFLYNSVGGKYVHDLLYDLFGKSLKAVNQTKKHIST